MIEFLGQGLLEKIWLDIAKILIGFADNKATELRQAACYGIGEFSNIPQRIIIFTSLSA